MLRQYHCPKPIPLTDKATVSTGARCASRPAPARPPRQDRTVVRNRGWRRQVNGIEQPSYIVDFRGNGIFLQIPKLLLPSLEPAMQPIQCSQPAFDFNPGASFVAASFHLCSRPFLIKPHERVRGTASRVVQLVSLTCSRGIVPHSARRTGNFYDRQAETQDNVTEKAQRRAGGI